MRSLAAACCRAVFSLLDLFVLLAAVACCLTGRAGRLSGALARALLPCALVPVAVVVPLWGCCRLAAASAAAYLAVCACRAPPCCSLPLVAGLTADPHMYLSSSPWFL